MQFKYLAALLASTAVSGVIAGPEPVINARALEARDEQAEQAQQMQQAQQAQQAKQAAQMQQVNQGAHIQQAGQAAQAQQNTNAPAADPKPAAKTDSKGSFIDQFLPSGDITVVNGYPYGPYGPYNPNRFGPGPYIPYNFPPYDPYINNPNIFIPQTCPFYLSCSDFSCINAFNYVGNINYCSLNSVYGPTCQCYGPIPPPFLPYGPYW